MKVTKYICDVCYSEGKKDVKANRKLTFKQGFTKVSIDVCETHREFGKGKTFEEFEKWCNTDRFITVHKPEVV
jgi:hypothetical protein